MASYDHWTIYISNCVHGFLIDGCDSSATAATAATAVGLHLQSILTTNKHWKSNQIIITIICNEAVVFATHWNAERLVFSHSHIAC